MLSNLKQNHIYLFSKQVPCSTIIEEFCAIFVNIINDNLLVRDFKKGKHNSCIRTMPKNWIISFTLLEELEYNM
jgi:hypothetical protein